MHVQTVLVDTSWLHNAWEMFLLFIQFSGKMVFLRKLKLIYLSTPHHYNNCSAPTLLTLFKKLLCPPLPPAALLFKKEGRDFAFYMRHYEGETTKFVPFYMTDFLFTEMKKHNIWRKLKHCMKNDIPNIRNYLISDTNLL